MRRIIDYMYDNGMSACYDPITNPGIAWKPSDPEKKPTFLTETKHPRYCM